MFFTVADISASNDDLWTAFLVLGIIVFVLWIVSWVIARGR
jgi:hypothetical protein